jgi:hypothetical protein
VSSRRSRSAAPGRGARAAAAAEDAAGILASIIGCLVFGALLPGGAAGFAAPFVARVIRSRPGPAWERDSTLARLATRRARLAEPPVAKSG